MRITLFDSPYEAYVKQEHELEWIDVVGLLCTHWEVAKKDAAPMFAMVRYKTLDDSPRPARKWIYTNGVKTAEYNTIPNTIARCKENIISLSGIVLDYDNGVTMDEVMNLYKGIEFIAYSSFNYTPEKQKFRVVIPFKQPLLAKDILNYKDSIAETFPNVDHASFTASQSFYMHSGGHQEVKYSQGAMLDPYKNFTWNAYVAPTIHEDVKIDDVNQDYKNALVKSLQSCSGLHFQSEKSKYGVLTLISICRSVGIGFDEFKALAKRMADPNSSSIADDTKLHSAWIDWSGNLVTKQVRNAFIKDYNGKAVRIERKYNPTVHLKERQEYLGQMNQIQQIRELLKAKENTNGRY
jgi:hypothetical protein|tara:strand:- start:1441 stop:2496 length:1056 start_codon:yes stop_codon:yes gene_type:complete